MIIYNEQRLYPFAFSPQPCERKWQEKRKLQMVKADQRWISMDIPFQCGSQIMWGQRAGHSSLASTKPCKIFVIPFTFQQLFRISEGNLRVWIKTYRGVHCFSRSSTTSCPSMVGGAFNYELSVIHGASFNIHFKYIKLYLLPFRNNLRERKEKEMQGRQVDHISWVGDFPAIVP